MGDASESYATFRKWVKTHMFLKEMKPAMKGAFLFNQLDGVAYNACEHLEFEEYAKEGGDVLIWTLLDKRYPARTQEDKMS